MGYKQDFIKFMVDSGVLTFGEFTLKSGRLSPYFMNSGNYKTGAQLARLGEFYAECIHDNGIEFDTLFGPAYKGIPLAVSTAVALYTKFGIDVNYCFDRKEALREVMPKLKETANVDVAAMIIQVDRMEKGLNGDKSAVQEVSGEFGVKIYPIVNMNDIIEAIEDGVVPGREYLEKMIEYRKVYGV